ncbi:MAG: peptidylprolyl isomerase [Agathobaculum sp.]|uniref:peptidylprolyl isomerase n=1 Tax=Agathobaculum sp. TaxID=2048138 RepID=UPI0025C611B7|nr:peptidylprolyl isomerase [Agathobaculum sp.]MCI7126095.1 peptidylprolyl isomerase [Agathobaculum sp.]MDY3712311.1 peptidylprolyl isomerase [Agathobaculum sp.]
MRKNMQRAIALVIMLAVVAGALMWRRSSTSFTYEPLASGAPTVMTVNGDAIPADEYATYFYYNMQYYTNLYAQFYGLMDIWDDPEMADMMGAALPVDARNQAVYTHVLLQEFDKAGLSLTDAQQRELYDVRQDLIEQSGGYNNYIMKIALGGFTDQTYSNFMYLSQVYAALDEYYFGENGLNKPSEDELKAYFRDNYISAKHILIGTTDPMTGEVKRTEEQAKADAQKVLDRLNAGEDFDAVMNEVSEDTGLASNPDGYIFTKGDMVEPFYEGAKALTEGQISALVKSDYGYHIIKREPLNTEGQYQNYQDAIAGALGRTMDVLLDQWMSEADVQTTELFDQISYQNVADYLPAEQQAAEVEAEKVLEQSAQAELQADLSGGEDTAQ